MTKKKGKARGISKHLKKFIEGQKVAILRNASAAAFFPKQIHGLTGTIKGKRGKSYIVALKQGRKEKRFIIPVVHLKTLNNNRKSI